MASWCADNLYDLKQWRDTGLVLTCSSNEAAKMFDAVLRQLVSWIDCEKLGGITKTVETMLESEPDFVMGKCLLLGMDAMGTGRSVLLDKSYEQQLEELLGMAGKCTPREEKHVKAVNYFAHGEMRSACVEWEKILAEHPTDLMAIKFSHDAYFFMGDNIGKRDSAERVINKWKPETPMYSYLHGMYAFGLEECGVHARMFSQVCERSKASKMMLDMVDATSLLLRLEMEGVVVGQDRWKELLEVVTPHIDDHILAFNDAHISMALSRVAPQNMMVKHEQSMSNFVSKGKGHDNWRIIRDLGQLLCEAIVDFNEGRSDVAFEKLYPIRTQIFQIGGSHAQRDVFTQVIIHAGLRSSSAVHKKIAVEVIEERGKLKPKSALADRLLAKHNAGHK